MRVDPETIPKISKINVSFESYYFLFLNLPYLWWYQGVVEDFSGWQLTFVDMLCQNVKETIDTDKNKNVYSSWIISNNY